MTGFVSLGRCATRSLSEIVTLGPRDPWSGYGRTVACPRRSNHGLLRKGFTSSVTDSWLVNQGRVPDAMDISWHCMRGMGCTIRTGHSFHANCFSWSFCIILLSCFLSFPWPFLFHFLVVFEFSSTSVFPRIRSKLFPFLRFPLFLYFSSSSLFFLLPASLIFWFLGMFFLSPYVNAFCTLWPWVWRTILVITTVVCDHFLAADWYNDF